LGLIFVILKSFNVFFLFSFDFLICNVMYKKNKKRKKEKKENNNRKRDVCVFVFFLCMLLN